MAVEKLFDVWAKRNPKWEIRFEEIIHQFTDYGVGSSELLSARGKVLGAGYEIFIYAFFIGLYADKKRELSGGTKIFGQPIQYWGNLDSKKFRKAYPQLRKYIFAALIAKTDLDLIALEKGNITVGEAVDLLKNTMEEYANYGFYTIEEKIKDNPNYFYKNTGFLNIIIDLVLTTNRINEEIEALQ
ncbi:MAG: glycoside hydrolase family 15 [Enterococcus sp.]|nr:glycoside hydrolase family 15 [Enterococcus sp.]